MQATEEAIINAAAAQVANALDLPSAVAAGMADSKINDKQAAMFYAAWYADFPDPDNFLYTLCHSNSRTNRCTAVTGPLRCRVRATMVALLVAASS